MYKYKNTTSSTLTVVGVGQVEAGATFECEEPLTSPNLELVPQVAEQPAAQPVVAKEQPQPATVTNAAPVNTTTEVQ